jgi:hypothetical protein
MSKEPLDNLLEHLEDVDLDLLAEAEEEDEATESVPEGTEKMDGDYAGYMELEGAEKDGGCKIVAISNGISKELGCCNLFHPVDGAKKFSCGTCKFED